MVQRTLAIPNEPFLLPPSSLCPFGSQDWRAQENLRFAPPPEEVPWGSVALAVFLAVFGAASLVLAWLHWTQQLFGKERAVRGWGFGVGDCRGVSMLQCMAVECPSPSPPSPLSTRMCAISHNLNSPTHTHAQTTKTQEVGFTVVGLLAFVPGAYHSFIAWQCFRGEAGYRWSDIPQL